MGALQDENFQLRPRTTADEFDTDWNWSISPWAWPEVVSSDPTVFDDPILEATRKFVVDFSTQPYQKSGSTLEALCPAIEPAMNRNSILLTFGKSSTDDFAAMHAELAECAKIHKSVTDLVGKDYPVALLIIYPCLLYTSPSPRD